MGSILVIDPAAELVLTRPEFEQLIADALPLALVSGLTAHVPAQPYNWQVFRLDSGLSTDGTLEQTVTLAEAIARSLNRDLMVYDTTTGESLEVQSRG